MMNEKQSRSLRIAVGTDNFKEMATKYDVFVDKTLFIKEIIDSSEKAILITYPRRWGKTLNLNMLKVFLEPEDKNCQKITRYEAITGMDITSSQGRDIHGQERKNFDIFLQKLDDFESKNSDLIAKKENYDNASLQKSNSEKELQIAESQLTLWDRYNYGLGSTERYLAYSALHDQHRQNIQKYDAAKLAYDRAKQEKAAAQRYLSAIGKVPSPCNKVLFEGGNILRKIKI